MEAAHKAFFESNNAPVANRTGVNQRITAAFANFARADAAERLHGTCTAFGFVNTLATEPAGLTGN